MKRLILIFFSALALITTVTVSLSLSNPAFAAKKSYSISLKIFKQMEEAQLFIEQEQYDNALEVLNELLDKRLSDYERAQIFNLIGSVYYRQSDYPQALLAFSSILDSVGAMPVKLHVQTLRTITQLHMIEEDFVAAKTFALQLIDTAEEQQQSDYALLAQIYYKLKDWKNTQDTAIRGADIAAQLGQIPQENLMILLNAAYYEAQQYTLMPAVLEDLIKYYPKTSYILYLASIYGQLGSYDKQLVLMESLYDDDKLTDRNMLRNLATLYIAERTPYKAAVLLQKAFDDGALVPSVRDHELLAQAWRLAAEREKALSALNIAAKMSENGDIFLQKAYLHFDMAQWSEANASIENALDKGLSAKYQGDAWLLLGMTRFKLKQFNKALEACRTARAFEDTEKHARQWISYISSEIEKYRSMQVPVS